MPERMFLKPLLLPLLGGVPRQRRGGSPPRPRPAAGQRLRLPGRPLVERGNNPLRGGVPCQRRGGSSPGQGQQQGSVFGRLVGPWWSGATIPSWEGCRVSGGVGRPPAKASSRAAPSVAW